MIEQVKITVSHGASVRYLQRALGTVDGVEGTVAMWSAIGSMAQILPLTLEEMLVCTAIERQCADYETASLYREREARAYKNAMESGLAMGALQGVQGGPGLAAQLNRARDFGAKAQAARIMDEREKNMKTAKPLADETPTIGQTV